VAVVVRTLDLANWVGRWVALDETDIVVRDEGTLAGLLDVVDADGLEGVQICRAPRPDDPIDFGNVFSFDFSGAG
jgi:hypothetical protein